MNSLHLNIVYNVLGHLKLITHEFADYRLYFVRSFVWFLIDVFQKLSCYAMIAIGDMSLNPDACDDLFLAAQFSS